MTRYFTRHRPPQAAYDDNVDYHEENPVRAISVHEPEQPARDTGLLDAEGRMIYASERVRCGFLG